MVVQLGHNSPGPSTDHLLIEKLISTNNLMPNLFEKKWNSTAKAWNTGEKAPTLGDAFRMFDHEILQVREDLKTGLIIVRVEWGDRERCAGILRVAVGRREYRDGWRARREPSCSARQPCGRGRVGVAEERRRLEQ